MYRYGGECIYGYCKYKHSYRYQHSKRGYTLTIDYHY